MASEVYYLIVIQTVVTKVIASYGTSPYLQYSSTYPSPAYITSYPANSYTTKPGYTSPYTPAGYPTYIQSSTAPSSSSYVQGYPAFVPPPAVSNPTSYPAAAFPTTPIAPKPAPKIDSHQQSASYLPKEPSVSSLPNLSPPKSSTPFDSNVLNNLAIALQLLIVSNLIHNPPELRSVSDVDEDMIPSISSLPIPLVPPESNPSYQDPNLYEYQQPPYSIPNANFLGSSTYADTGISKAMMSAYGSPTLAKPRSLKSPYDSIASYSPYTDSNDISSPYNLNSDYNKLFSLAELFKV